VEEPEVTATLEAGAQVKEPEVPATLGSGSQDSQRGGKVTKCQEDDRSAELQGAILDRQAVQNPKGAWKEPEVAAMLEAGSKERLPGRTSSQDQGELKGIRVPAPTQRGKKDKDKKSDKASDNLHKGTVNITGSGPPATVEGRRAAAASDGKQDQPDQDETRKALREVTAKVLEATRKKQALQERVLELQVWLQACNDDILAQGEG